MAAERWNLEPKQVQFLNDVLNTHKKVISFQALAPGVYHIERGKALSSLKVLVIDVYTVGQADVVRGMEQVPNLDCLVTLSGYNGYTEQAKTYAKEQGVALFVLKEFMGALWRDGQEFLEFVLRDDKGQPILIYRRSA
jgi:hypothetical protein